MRLTQIFIHLCLIFFVILFLLPFYAVFIASIQAWHVLINNLPSFFFILKNNIVMAFFIALGKVVFSFLSAYALVYFRFSFRKTAFFLIFMTLMLPVETRMMSTFQLMLNLHLLNSMLGVTLPLFASAIGTFLFYHLFLSIPDELFDMAKIDGLGPLRFLWHVVLPLSKTYIAILFVLMFIYGWNQYLWPLVVIHPVEMAANQVLDWHLLMTATMLALVPLVLIVLPFIFNKMEKKTLCQQSSSKM